MRVRGFLRRSRHFLGLQRTFRLGSDAAEDKVVSPSPTTGGKKLEQLGGARPPQLLGSCRPLQAGSVASEQGGDGAGPQPHLFSAVENVPGGQEKC